MVTSIKLLERKKKRDYKNKQFKLTILEHDFSSAS